MYGLGTGVGHHVAVQHDGQLPEQYPETARAHVPDQERGAEIPHLESGVAAPEHRESAVLDSEPDNLGVRPLWAENGGASASGLRGSLPARACPCRGPSEA